MMNRKIYICVLGGTNLHTKKMLILIFTEYRKQMNKSSF